jgi:hypothetical protein
MKLFQRRKKKFVLPDEALPPEPPLIVLEIPLTNGCTIRTYYSLS